MDKKMKRYFVCYRFEKPNGSTGWANAEIESEKFWWIEVTHSLEEEEGHKNVILIFWKEL